MAKPRKPVQLHLVQGTGRKDRHNLTPPTAAEADVTGLPAPAHLSGRATAAWAKLSPMLARMGVLTVADELALERLCECYAEILDHTEALALAGAPTYETRSVKDGLMIRARPEVGMLADADRRFKAYLGEFGLTPAAFGSDCERRVDRLVFSQHRAFRVRMPSNSVALPVCRSDRSSPEPLLTALQVW